MYRTYLQEVKRVDILTPTGCVSSCGAPATRC